jgi:hypothetical protein
VYSREIDGQEYSFGVSGKLIMNVLVMYDRETGSLWSQLLGEAVEGELKGTNSLSDPEALTLSDAETGSIWEGLTGLAIDGPLAGEQLTRVKSTSSFWFGWKDWYPETRVYGTAE